MTLEFLYVLMDAIYIIFPFVYLDDDLDHKADAKFIGNHILLVWLYAVLNMWILKLDLTNVQKECITLFLAFLIIFFYEMKIDLYRVLIGLASLIISDMSILCVSSLCQRFFDIQENAILLTFVVKIIRMILLICICRYVRKVINLDQKEQLKDGVMLLLPFSILFELCFHRAFTGNNPYAVSDRDLLQDPYLLLQLYMITASLILTAIFMNHFYLTKQHLQQEKMILEAARLSSDKLQEIEKQENEIKKIRHDMIARLVTIRTFYQDGQIKKADKAIEETIGVIQDTKLEKYCAIDYVNHLIKYKMDKNQNINFSVESNCTSDPNIDPMDLSVLLSNLIDNACRENCKAEIKEKYVSVSIIQNHELLMIEVKNPIVHAADLRSDKTGNDHGFGLQIVKNIVNQYDGYMDILQDTEFKVKVLLNLKKEESEMKRDENQNYEEYGNYFIKFKDEGSKKEAMLCLNKIAKWENYGSLGIRGNAPEREVIAKTIAENTSLTKDDFEIIQGFPGYLVKY